MERFTNDYQQLLNEVKRELLAPALRPPEELLVSYLELPWFAGGQLAWHLAHDPLARQHRLVWLAWDAAYDLGRFATRVYNLDRLRYWQHTCLLTAPQQQQLAAIMAALTLPDTLEQTGYIMLDGVEYELKLPAAHLRWRLANDHFTQVKPLLDFLKDLTPPGQASQTTGLNFRHGPRFDS